MQILSASEKTVSIGSGTANAAISFENMTASAVAVQVGLSAVEFSSPVSLSFNHIASLFRVLPTKGPSAGGTHVTITAVSIAFEKSVVHCLFGDLATEALESNSTQVVCVTPRATTGSVNLLLSDEVGDVLTDRCNNAMDVFLKAYSIDSPQLVVAGGVAANFYLRSCLEKLCDERKVQMIAPPPELCTDNAAMIAWAGLEHLRRGGSSNLNFAPRPRWPLDEL